MSIIAVFLRSFTYFHIPGVATTNGVAMGPKKHVIVGTKPDRLGYPKVGYLGPSAIVMDGFGYRRAVSDMADQKTVQERALIFWSLSLHGCYEAWL